MRIRFLTSSMPPVLALLLLIGCQTNSRDQILAASESQVALRQIQSRTFETADRNALLRAVIATLQDLSFVIDKADATLGSVSATKLDGYQLRMTVTVRPKSETQLLVRASAQYNLTAVEDPEPYQQFFAALEKSVFLAARMEEEAAAAEPLSEEAKVEERATPAYAPGPSETASTNESPAAGANSFDGVWILEIGETSAMNLRDRVSTVVTDGRFSASFETNGWRGRITGEIDQSGTLTAEGSASKMAWGSNNLTIALTSPYRDGGFRDDVLARGRASTSFRISLTRTEL